MVPIVGDDWMSYRDNYVAVLLACNSLTPGQAFTIANRAADVKFGKRNEPTLPGKREKPDPSTRRAREECVAILNKLLVSGVFKSRREMHKWANEHTHYKRQARVTSFTLDECNTLLARLAKLERM